MAKTGTATLALFVVLVASSTSSLVAAQEQASQLTPTQRAAIRAQMIWATQVELIDGPYTYKGASDLVPILGWKIVESKLTPGQEEVRFRLCNGAVKTV